MKYFFMLIVLSTITVIYVNNLYSSNNLNRLQIDEVTQTTLNNNYLSLRNYTDNKIDIAIQSNDKEQLQVSIPKSCGVLINCSNNNNYKISLNEVTKNLICGEIYIISEDIANEYEI